MSKRLRRLIILLVILLIASVIYNVVQKLDFKEQVTLKTQFIEEKNALRDDLDDLIDDHELLKDEYSELNDQLYERDSLISAYAADIKKLLRSEGQLKEAKKKIVRLKEISRKYISDIDSLLILNEDLINENDSVKKANRVILFRNRNLQSKNQQLEERVNTASVLKITNIEIEGLHYRSSGKEVSTTKSHKIQKFRICYTVLENKVADPGLKEVYVRITSPDGSILNIANEALLLELQDTVVEYTVSQKFEYQNSIFSNCILWARGNVLTEGSYKFEFLVEGKVLAVSERKFK